MSIIIVGAGEIGYNLARELSIEKKDVVIIEANPEKVDQLEEAGEDITMIQGSGSNPEVLKKAGIEQAELLVAVTESDERNIVACYIASKLAPDIKKIARIRGIDTHLYGHFFWGEPPVIDSVINPEELCAMKMADLLQLPGVTDINRFLDGRVLLLGIKINDTSPVKGKNLIQIGQERSQYRMNLLIASIIRGEDLFVPSARDSIMEGDILYIITLEEEVKQVVQYLCGQQEEIKNVAILGGSNVGYYLARIIEQKKFDVKLIEPDARRAEFLSEMLSGTLVLKGEILDRAICDIEGIYKSDVFVATTADQEENIIATLYAKSKGVKTGICMLTRGPITALVKKIGVDICLNSQQVAIGKILEYIRKGTIGSVVLLNRNDIEVIEAKPMKNSVIANRLLKDIKLPKSSLLLAIARSDGSIEIPNGESKILPNEWALFICKKEGVSALEKLIDE